MGYTPGQGAGSTSGGAAPGTSGNKGKGMPLVPLAGADKYERKSTNVELYYQDVHGRQQVHHGKFLFDLLVDPSRMSVDDVHLLQQQLYDAGYYGTLSAKNMRWGDRYDVRTREALGRAIVDIGNTQKTGEKGTFFEILRNRGAYLSEAAARSLAGGSGRERAPFSFQPADPQELRDAFAQIVPSVLGRKLSDAETEELVKQFQARQISAAKSAYAAEAAGGIAQPAPDFESFAKQKTKELHGDEADTFGKFNIVNDAMKILGIGATSG